MIALREKYAVLNEAVRSKDGIRSACIPVGLQQSIEIHHGGYYGLCSGTNRKR